MMLLEVSQSLKNMGWDPAPDAQCPRLLLSPGQGILQTQEGTGITDSWGRCAMTRERMLKSLLKEKRQSPCFFNLLPLQRPRTTQLSPSFRAGL
jgi:hypothetical protein